MEPAYVLPSARPMKKRAAQSCSNVLQAALTMVKPAHARIMEGSHLLGRTFWIIRLWGIWPISMLYDSISAAPSFPGFPGLNVTYPAEAMDRSTLYWLPSRFKSSLSPATCYRCKDQVRAKMTTGATDICIGEGSPVFGAC